MSAAVVVRFQRTFQQNRSLIAILFVLCVVIYFMLAFADQAWRARQLQAEADQQRTAIAMIEQDNEAMQRKIDMYESGAYADYVQSRARRDLNLANPDETVLLVRWGVRPTAPEGDQASAASADERPNWKRWIDAFSGH